MKFMWLVVLLGLSGCASVPLTPQERAVRVLRKSDPPANCSELARVKVSGFMRPDIVGIENDLKREVAKAGGNLATIDSRDQYGSIAATAYNCPAI